MKKSKKKIKNNVVKTDLVEIKTEDFLDILTALRPGLAATVVQQTSSYLLMNDAIGTFNDELFILIDDFKTGFVGTVKADVLYKLVQKLNDENISFYFTKNKMKVKAGGTSFALSTGDIGQLKGMIDEFEFDKTKWEKADRELPTALEICSHYTSTDMEEPHLTGVLVDGKDVLASDRYRISWYELETVSLKKPFILPSTSSFQLGKYKFPNIAIEDNWVYFKSNNFYICARLIGDVSFAKDMLEPFKRELSPPIELPESFILALDRVLIVLEKKDIIKREVKLTISKEEIRIEADPNEVGQIEENVPFNTGVKKTIQFKVNPSYLRDILKRTNIMQIEKDQSMLFFQADKFKHVISLV